MLSKYYVKVKSSRLPLIIILIAGLFIACHSRQSHSKLSLPENERVYRITEPAGPRLKGDPDRGFSYLVNGGFVGSGIPYDFLVRDTVFRDSFLRRGPEQHSLTYDQISFTGRNGARVISGNCFTCHASVMQDSLALGLGNSFSDFRKKIPGGLLWFFVKRKVGKKSAEWEEFYDYGFNVRKLDDRIQTNQFGINTAFRLEEASVSHRDPQSLKIQKDAVFEMDDYNIGSDVPPLWNVKKKAALYYNGMGRGSFSKLLMQASALGVHDSASARMIHENFDDVVAWLESLEAPKYPKAIDKDLAIEGKKIFTANCKKCHGTYGKFPQYPNRIVPLSEVKTDPEYARCFMEGTGLPDWYNKSWFATSSPRSYIKPSDGYIAPPLDGVWATAPYLHNGSVPDLESLL
ncbi:MAG: hypothetical protein AAF206_27245, partial [Bacteroidota bacterium]